ncbi:hypothetical protein CPB84DRAFT_1850694 [Gymnopilus junonius]|uniref:DUF6534 domain-containing protein n=1 Tax=Gymnopilus junonius TaxID=109634 RepID=A0A9P5NHU3_GYMJU|nr:hypothetical protein CPB84DRAFT_1850694 [Gymnopilus junonius]
MPRIVKQWSFGSILNWAFLGTVTIQVYLYATSGFKDSNWIRGLGMCSHPIIEMKWISANTLVGTLVILGWGNPAGLDFPPWTSTTFPIMSGIIGALVQIFFAWRIWVLKKNYWAGFTSIIIILVALMQCISGTTFAIRSAFINILDIAELHPRIIVWLVGAFTADIIIVFAMLYILHSSKTPNFVATNRLIDRLMFQTIHSGAITAAAALVELILFLIAPNNFMHDTIALFLGKLYSNVLLANLNGRRKNDTTYSTVYDSMYLSSRGQVFNSSTTHFVRGQSDTQLNGETIQIKTFKEVQHDSKPDIVEV